MIADQLNEITLIYHSGKEGDENVRNYVETMGFDIKVIDLNSQKLNEEQLREIVYMLEVQIADLFDPAYAGHLQISTIREAVSLLTSNPKLLATPIIIIGEHAYQFEY